ncbi:carbohydrate ABC transporter permease [Desnuesiella massiliensis]|uniref:carbohydrate ABC transporter permease n=1 Tax=Desnuesiella massiliensis TaxID=1650662 RepID=UPI0006E2C86D|nr:carbohydrate ABC transporter permease [Desnuesiella massiliensis]
MSKSEKVKKLVLTLILGIVATFMLFPILITITNSFMPEEKVTENYQVIGTMPDKSKGNTFANLSLIPEKVSTEQYTSVIKDSTFKGKFQNSIFMVIPIILGQLVVASLAAYVFAKINFLGRDTLFMIYVLTMIMPFQVTVVPNYIIANHLGLLNTASSIIFPGIFGALGVFVLRQFMINIPNSYIEAAKIDGAGHFTIFFKVILPLIRPAIGVLVVLLFADYWNMIEQPLIFLEDKIKQPLSLYLSQLNKETLGSSFATSILYMLPLIAIFLYAKSYFVKSEHLSGIK